MVKKSYNTIKIERQRGITWLILNRPEKRNAINDEMRNAIRGLQDKLLESGAIKEASDLEATIKNSMTGKDGFELYLNNVPSKYVIEEMIYSLFSLHYYQYSYSQ